MTEEMKKRGVKASYAYMEGTAANEIISYAEGNGCDLIAMAIHGKGEVPGYSAVLLKRWFSTPCAGPFVACNGIKPPISKKEYAMRIMGPD